MSHQKEKNIQKSHLNVLFVQIANRFQLIFAMSHQSKKMLPGGTRNEKNVSGVSGIQKNSSCALIAMVSISVNAQYYLKTKH